MALSSTQKLIATLLLVVLLVLTWAVLLSEIWKPADKFPLNSAVQGNSLEDQIVWSELLSVSLDFSIFNRNAKSNTIAVVFANAAEYENGLLLNFICFSRAKSKNIIYVVTDYAMQEQLIHHYSVHAYYSPQFWANVSNSVLRQTRKQHNPKYFNFIFHRLVFIYRLLTETSLNIIITDADTVWVRDPMSVIPLREKPDCSAFWMMTDHSTLNGGFYYLRNNAQTRAFVKEWVSRELQFKLAKSPEQSSLNSVPHGMLDICELPTSDFMTGRIAFGHHRRAQSLWHRLSQVAYGRKAPAISRKESLRRATVIHFNYGAKTEKVFIAKKHKLWGVNVETGQCLVSTDAT